MKDYNIYVHGERDVRMAPTNPQYRPTENRVCAEQPQERQAREQRHHFSGLKATGIALASASKINGYVGEITQNVVQQRKRNVGLTLAGFAATSVYGHPFAAAAAGALYFGNKAIEYGIKIHDENLSADYLRQLSGGVSRTR